MSPGLILLTLLCFVAGIALSIWQTRRRFRARLADRLAHEVEREIARRVVADLRSGKLGAQQPPREP
jgi:uncharacterized protein YneF (UPF0154 family)